MVKFNNRKTGKVEDIPHYKKWWEGAVDANGDPATPCNDFIPMDDEYNVDVCRNCLYHRLDHD